MKEIVFRIKDQLCWPVLVGSFIQPHRKLVIYTNLIFKELAMKNDRLSVAREEMDIFGEDWHEPLHVSSQGYSKHSE